MRRRLSCLLACMWAHACVLACKRGRLAQSPILGVYFIERAPPFFGDQKETSHKQHKGHFHPFFCWSCAWILLLVVPVAGCLVCVCLFVCVCLCLCVHSLWRDHLSIPLPSTPYYCEIYIYSYILLYIQDIQSFCHHYSFIHLLGVRRWRLCVSKKRLCGAFLPPESCLQCSFFGRRVHRHEHTNTQTITT